VVRVCSAASSFPFHLRLESSFEGEGFVKVASSLVEFVLELDPMESERVQEALEHVHQHEHAPCDSHVCEPEDEGPDGDSNYALGRSIYTICVLVPLDREHESQEHLSELGMGQGQGPESQVRGGVGDSSEDEFDGLDHLMDEEVAEGLTMRMLTTTMLLGQDLLVGLHFSLGISFLVGQLVGIVFGSFNLVKVLFLMVWWLAAVGHRAWLDAKHHWDGDEHEDQQHLVDRLLRIKEVYILSTELQEIVDHDGDDGRVVT